MHAFLNTAIRAARDAGDIILQNMDDLDRIQIEHKDKNDLVSIVDIRAEEAIIELVNKYYPDHATLGEESGLVKGKDDSTEVVWIIDPLDGTTNYLHGYQQFCVSIAIRVNNRVEHGVVYDPTRDEMFVASRGQGARLNDKRIRVSEVKGLQDALVATGFPIKKFDNLNDILALLGEVIPQCHGVRRGGSAALDLAYVAAGRADAYWEEGLQPWDVSAGALIVREAGGIVSDFEGGSDYWHNGQVIASSPKVYSALQKLVKKHLV